MKNIIVKKGFLEGTDNTNLNKIVADIISSFGYPAKVGKNCCGDSLLERSFATEALAIAAGLKSGDVWVETGSKALKVIF